LTASIIVNALWILCIVLMDQKISKLKRAVDELSQKSVPPKPPVYSSYGLLGKLADILEAKNVRRISVEAEVGSVATATIETLIENQHGDLIADCVRQSLENLNYGMVDDACHENQLPESSRRVFENLDLS